MGQIREHTAKKLLNDLVSHGGPGEIQTLLSSLLRAAGTQETEVMTTLLTALAHLTCWLRENKDIWLTLRDIGQLAEHSKIYMMSIDQKIPFSCREAAVTYVQQVTRRSKAARKMRKEIEAKLQESIAFALSAAAEKGMQDDVEQWVQEQMNAWELRIQRYESETETPTVSGMEFLTAEKPTTFHS